MLQLLNKVDAPAFTEEDQEAMETFCYEAALALKRVSMDAVFLKLFEEEGEFPRNHSLSRIPSNTGFESIGGQPYQVRELSAGFTGTTTSSVASAANRRFFNWKCFRSRKDIE